MIGRPLVRALLLLPLLAPAVPLAAEETPFEPGLESFANAAACKAHLVRLLTDARRLSYAAIEGPYDVAAGDIRIHLVQAEGGGHRITESRCLAVALSSRSWTHSMGASQEEFSVESVARTAEWLKQGAAKQQ